MGKKLVMAQKRGETRALCLGVTMVVCAVIAYYILGTTVLPLYQKRYQPPRPACPILQPLPHQGSGLGGTPDFFPPFPLAPTPGREIQMVLTLRVKDCWPDWALLVWNSGTCRPQTQEILSTGNTTG